MKTYLLSILLVLVLLASCHGDCSDNMARCKDKAPRNEACDAAFNRWFYVSVTNNCKQVAYSGCNAHGFETREACESCKCD